MVNRRLPGGFALWSGSLQKKWLKDNGIDVRSKLDVTRDTYDAAGDFPRTEQRMYWIVRWIANECCQITVAWHEDTVNLFVESFPEAKKTLVVYTMGPNSSPMLNRAAKRAEANGFLKAGVIGNDDARSYNQRTWCRTWSLTEKGAKLVDIPFDRESGGVSK